MEDDFDLETELEIKAELERVEHPSVEAKKRRGKRKRIADDEEKDHFVSLPAVRNPVALLTDENVYNIQENLYHKRIDQKEAMNQTERIRQAFISESKERIAHPDVYYKSQAFSEFSKALQPWVNLIVDHHVNNEKSISNLTASLLQKLGIQDTLESFKYFEAMSKVKLTISDLTRKHAELQRLVGGQAEVKKRIPESEQLLYDVVELEKLYVYAMKNLDALKFFIESTELVLRASSPDSTLVIPGSEAFHESKQPLKPEMKFILMVKDSFLAHGYRRHGKYIYAEIYHQGHPTNAFEPYRTIEKWLQENYDSTTEHYPVLAKHRKFIQDELAKTDAKFPEMEWDTSLTAWGGKKSGGWYISMKSKPNFSEYISRRGQRGVNMFDYLTAYDEFIPFTNKQRLLDICPHYSKRAAIKFFEQDFIKEDLPEFTWYNEFKEERHSPDFRQMKIPADNYFTYQGYQDNEELMNIYGHFGRLQHPLQKFDNRVGMPCLAGMAGCGKSSILNHLKLFYDPDQIFIIPGNIEQGFGLQRVKTDERKPSIDHEKDRYRIWISSDVPIDWTMSASNLLSMISKEDVTINVKYEDSCQQDWALPGAVAWNVIPKLFSDAKGEWKARLFYINFSRALENDAEIGLYERSLYSFSRFYRKSALAYIWWSQQGYGRQTKNPPKFMLACKRAISERNIFQGFLLSDMVRQRDEMTQAERKEADEVYVPTEEILAQYRRYVKEHNLGKTPMSALQLEDEMKMAGFKLFKGQKEWPPEDPRPKTATWYQGIIFLGGYSHTWTRDKFQTLMTGHFGMQKR